MKHCVVAAALWVSLVVLAHAQAPAGMPAAVNNLLPNPSFEMVEPPAPTPATAMGKPIPPESYLPRTWNVAPHGGAEVLCPEDAAAAHSGKRCVRLKAPQGRAVLRYSMAPVPFKGPWTVRLWARGAGKLTLLMYQVGKDKWTPLEPKVFSLPKGSPLREGRPGSEYPPEGMKPSGGKEGAPAVPSGIWRELECQLDPKDSRLISLDFAADAPADLWIDDVFVSYPGLPALNLPPTKPLGKDAETLLYLPFEEWFDEDAFFVKQKASLSKEGEGVFGKCLVLGPEGYVACSANENVDPAQGTIEIWFRLLTPGSDGLYRSIVGVPGMEGLMLAKDQYSHVVFAMSTGWHSLCRAVAMGYAWHWQPGVWRHLAASWDKDLIQLFVDGKLVAWECNPKLPRTLGPELAIGSANLELDDLRISRIVRYRQPVPPPEK